MEHLRETLRFKFYDTSIKDQAKWTYYGYTKDQGAIDMKHTDKGEFTYKMKADWKAWRVPCIVEYDTSTKI